MSAVNKIKIVLADDHIILRDGLAGLINDFEQCSIIGKASDGGELQQLLINGLRPDLVILDLNMPRVDGYEAAKWLRKNHPEVKILVLTMFGTEIALLRLLKEGVRGFLKKDIQSVELNKAIVAVMEQGYYYSSNANNKFSEVLLRTVENEGSIHDVLLSSSEINFLKWVATDLTYKEIAVKLQLTPRTVDHWRDTLFTKLNVKSRVGLAIYAMRNGIVSFD